MIDTHLHILPGVDDGPETVEEALALAKALVEERVHTAIATPHYNDLYPQRSALEVKERVNELQLALDHQSIPLRLFSGHEALIKPGLVEDIQAGRLATLNGSRYLLLELWDRMWLPETERVVFELRAHGFIPIIAHPERYRAIQQDSTRLANVVKQGVLAQLTASSLIGMQGNRARHCAETLLKKGLIHCIASDAHGRQTRPPSVLRGLQYAERLLDRERVRQMVEIWPAMILNDEVFSIGPVNKF